jgi:uncharacterized protein YprB with RNaseH-like and TPR domain
MKEQADDSSLADYQTRDHLREADSHSPITEAFQHCFGIGPARHRQLQSCGIRSWRDAVNDPEQIPIGIRGAVVTESKRCLSALKRQDIDYFLQHFTSRDKWRVLEHYLEQTAFFDIETTGLEYDAQITVICCWHRDQLHTFVEHENLDDFLDLLDDVKLLASFNGATFDVPRVLAAFHIPNLPCAHVDLRWPCYHHGHRGGLKAIAQQQQIQRPKDLQDADGAMAVQLWNTWIMNRDEQARDRLIRYCASDVLLLAMVARRIIGKRPLSADAMWAHLPSVATGPYAACESLSQQTVDPSVWSPPSCIGSFGAANPSKLRARRRTA